MSATPDLSLPATAPSMRRYHGQELDLHPAALYTLVDFSEEELRGIKQECEAECVKQGHSPDSTVRLAPQCRFVDQPLRVVLDYHLELGTQDTYDPRYFIVVIEKDVAQSGVLLVSLDDDEQHCNVDAFRIRAKDVGLSVVNMQIVNSSWDEEKECYEIHADERSEGPGSDGDNGGDYDSDSSGPPPPKKNSHLGCYGPVYIHAALSPDDVVNRLQPELKHFKVDPEMAFVRVQAALTPSSSAPSPAQDLVAQAVALHPRRCTRNQWLHKNYLLVIDTTDPMENGMLIVKMDWDGRTTDSVTKQESQQLSTEVANSGPSQIRIPYSDVAGLQQRFIPLAKGLVEWPSELVRKQSVYCVFQYNTPGKLSGFGGYLLDPKAPEKPRGEERFVYASVSAVLNRAWTGRHETIVWSFDEAVRLFPSFCRENRFVENLDTDFFICVDGVNIEEDGVLLGRRHWDGQLWERSYEDLLRLDIVGVKSSRVPVKQALGILDRGRLGDTEGMSPELVDFFRN